MITVKTETAKPLLFQTATVFPMRKMKFSAKQGNVFVLWNRWISNCLNKERKWAEREAEEQQKLHLLSEIKWMTSTLVEIIFKRQQPPAKGTIPSMKLVWSNCVLNGWWVFRAVLAWRSSSCSPRTHNSEGNSRNCCSIRPMRFNLVPGKQIYIECK